VKLTFGAAGTRPEVSARPDADRRDDARGSRRRRDRRAWVARGFEGFRRQGFAPEAIVATTTEPLDGRESVVRNRAGKLTDTIAEAIGHEAGASTSRCSTQARSASTTCCRPGRSPNTT
jgi:hypothetical protein